MATTQTGKGIRRQLLCDESWTSVRRAVGPTFRVRAGLFCPDERPDWSSGPGRLNRRDRLLVVVVDRDCADSRMAIRRRRVEQSLVDLRCPLPADHRGIA